jgi:hypothetical protein
MDRVSISLLDAVPVDWSEIVSYRERALQLNGLKAIGPSHICMWQDTQLFLLPENYL